jgi:alkane 1-monooxygenase
MQNLVCVLPFVAPYIVLALAHVGVQEGGWLTLLAFGFVFGIHPLLDFLIGPEKTSSVLSEGPAWLHDVLLRAYLPAQTLLLLGAYQMKLQPTEPHFWGAALSLGVASGGMGITIAHELIHRTKKTDWTLGTALLAQVNYAHFETEHLMGHHVWVGTPKDPATARAGESLFRFLPRTLLGSFLGAYRLKPQRTYTYITIQLLIAVSILMIFGASALLLHFLQSAFAILLLETVNYIEHYGLSRREIRPGVFEKVSEHHSWNSLHRMTNWFLFNLGRHAEHHAHPRIPYQKLKPTPRRRTFPFGYSTMVLMAWAPPLWMRFFHGNEPEKSGLLTPEAPIS